MENDVIRAVELMLGILGLVVGLWHLVEMRPLLKKLAKLSTSAERHLSALKNVQREITTKPIGQFPRYLKPIAELLEHAKEEIIILCDFPAYGSFSAHHDFVDYRHALEKVIDKGVKVEITCLDSKRRENLVHEQFAEEENNWKAWRDKPENGNRIELLFRGQGMDKPVSEISFDDFAQALKDEDRQVLTQTFAEARSQQIKAHIPIYFWIVDGDSAIFAIPNYSKRAVEHGFQTHDRNLIVGFKELRERYLNLHEQAQDGRHPHNGQHAPSRRREDEPEAKHSHDARQRRRHT